MNHGAPARDGHPVRVVGIEEPQRAEVLERPRDRLAEGGVGGVDQRYGAPPLSESAHGLGVGHRLTAHVAGRQQVAVEGERHAEAAGPLGTAGDHDLPVGTVGLDHDLAVELHRDLAVHARTAVDEVQGGAVHAVTLLALRLGPALLDREQVGEVAVDGEVHVQPYLVGVVVADRDVLAHARPDIAPAQDQHRALVLGRAHAAHARDEGRGERLVDGHRERLGHHPVDRELETRQQPGVHDEQTLDRAGVDVAAAAGQGERRLLDEGHRATAAEDGGALTGERPGFVHASTVDRVRVGGAFIGLVQPGNLRVTRPT